MLRQKFKTAGKAFLAMKFYKNMSKELRQRKLMIQKHCKNNLRKKAFNHLKKLWVEKLKMKTKETVTQEMGEQMEDMSMKFTKQIQMLEKGLKDANQTIQMHEQNKLELQQNLKNAFLKGLCAMNFEAMNVLGSNNNVLNIDQAVLQNTMNNAGKFSLF